MAKRNLNKEQRELNAKEVDIRLKQGASFVGSSNDPFSTPTRDNAQTYPYDYFAGTDCKVFFGDIWVDDIVTIQYNVTQSKTPIYGYASQNFDAVARGQVLVEGTLAISFKETGYLNVIQAQLEAQLKNSKNGIQGKIQSYQPQPGAKAQLSTFVPGINTIGEAGEPIDFTYSPTGTPEIIRQQQTIEQILTNKKGKENLSSAAIGKVIGTDGTQDFEDFAEILEDSIWGDSNGKFLALEDKLKRVDEFDYNKRGGIDTAKNSSYADVLNIMLTFGDINDYRAEHTVVVLNDVHFLSTSMIVSPDGNPIAEAYNFIARDINKSITSKTKSISIQPIKLDVGNDALTLSKLADVDAVQSFLEQNTYNAPIIKIESVLKDEFFWETWNLAFKREDFRFNKITPFIDQLCSFVENRINNSFDEYTEVFPDGRYDKRKISNYSQLIVSVDFSNSIGVPGVNNKITMILEQGIPGTYTYKVISPTRSGFGSVTKISRDDFFHSYTPPIPEELTKEEQAKNALGIKIPTTDPLLDLPLPTSIEFDPNFNPAKSEFERGIEETLRKAEAEQATTATPENTQSEVDLPPGILSPSVTPAQPDFAGEIDPILDPMSPLPFEVSRRPDDSQPLPETATPDNTQSAELSLEEINRRKSETLNLSDINTGASSKEAYARAIYEDMTAQGRTPTVQDIIEEARSTNTQLTLEEATEGVRISTLGTDPNLDTRGTIRVALFYDQGLNRAGELVTPEEIAKTDQALMFELTKRYGADKKIDVRRIPGTEAAGGQIVNYFDENFDPTKDINVILAHHGPGKATISSKLNSQNPENHIRGDDLAEALDAADTNASLVACWLDPKSTPFQETNSLKFGVLTKVPQSVDAQASLYATIETELQKQRAQQLAINTPTTVFESRELGDVDDAPENYTGQVVGTKVFKTSPEVLRQNPNLPKYTKITAVANLEKPSPYGGAPIDVHALAAFSETPSDTAHILYDISDLPSTNTRRNKPLTTQERDQLLRQQRMEKLPEEIDHQDYVRRSGKTPTEVFQIESNYPYPYGPLETSGRKASSDTAKMAAAESAYGKWLQS